MAVYRARVRDLHRGYISITLWDVPDGIEPADYIQGRIEERNKRHLAKFGTWAVQTVFVGVVGIGKAGNPPAEILAELEELEQQLASDVR